MRGGEEYGNVLCQMSLKKRGKEPSKGDNEKWQTGH